jgi:hypothetical protein
MKKLLLVVIIIGMVMAGCKPQSDVTPEEALCGTLTAFKQSITDLQELDSNSTKDDLEKAKDYVVASFQQLQWAAEDMAGINTQNINNKLDDLQKAVENLAVDTPIDQALGSIEDEITDLLGEISVVAAAAKCE